MNDITLAGCNPEPFASYLKAISILRLVSEQKDKQAKGYWKEGVFHLVSSLDAEGLVKFFREEYIPSPIVSPWNGGSGFYEGDSCEGRDFILNSTDARLKEYRETIASILNWPEMPRTNMTAGEMIKFLEDDLSGKRGRAKDELLEMLEDVRTMAGQVKGLTGSKNPLDITIDEIAGLNDKSGKDKTLSNFQRAVRKLRTKVTGVTRGGNKEKIVLYCRSRLVSRAVEWLDAAIILGDDSEIICPPLLVTGGNEGRLDYSNNFMYFVKDTVFSEKREQSEELLRNSLFNDATSNLTCASVGQLDPGRAGGYNQGPEIETKNFPVNPWNFILALEGSISWRGSIVRRHNARGSRLACSPFTVRQTPAGYSSASDADKDKSNGEIWAPLWENPTCYPELSSFIGEGRAEIGYKSAENGIEFAEAIASLGVDRGVKEFTRYALLKRRGDNLVAVPLSRYPVKERREVDLIRQLAQPLASADRFIRNYPEPPAGLASTRRNVDEAIYSALLQGGKGRMKSLIAALGRLERILSVSGRSGKTKGFNPVSGLSPDWILAADDGSVELRIAAALASIGKSGNIGPVRANISPVDPQKQWKWATGKGQQCWEGNCLSIRLARVLSRRLMDHARLGSPKLPFSGYISIHPRDAAAFIESNLDEKLLEDLLFGLGWVDWKKSGSYETCQGIGQNWRTPVSDNPVSWAYAQLKLLFHPYGVRMPDGSRINVQPESRVIPLLLAGRVSEACTIAQRRLYASGFTPFKAKFPNSSDGARLAAALLIPVQTSSELERRALGS